MINANVQAVIAMQHRITNQAAITFSRKFYRELAAGKPVDEAVQKGRQTMEMGEESSTFGTPVLYMRSGNGIILPSQEAVGTKSVRPTGQANL